MYSKFSIKYVGELTSPRLRELISRDVTDRQLACRRISGYQPLYGERRHRIEA